MNRSTAKTLRFAALSLTLAATGHAAAGGLVDPEFDWANDFVFGGHDPLVIDNAWWPLIPGTMFTYTAETEDECELNVVTVLPGQKNWGDVEDDRYDGISARIVHDIEFVDEECEGDWGDAVEETFDWYAQDLYDNIWYLGEDTISYDHEGECDNWVDENDPDAGCADGSFQAGVDGAEAGIVMLGAPFKGAFYQQEYYEDEAEDMGKVLNFVPVEIDLGEFEGCLKTKEWTPLEPGSVEHKFYCMPVGLVLIEELTGGPTKDVELVDVDVVPPLD